MTQANAYLFFDGTCEEALNLYQRVVGGQITALMRVGGSPAESHFPQDFQGKILHACLDLGGHKLMASDAPPGRYNKPQGFCVQLQVGSVAEAERIFAALEEGGTVMMPLEKTFWAERFGMLVDRFGTPWMVNHDLSGTA